MLARTLESNPQEPLVYRRDDARQRIYVTALRTLSRDDFACVLARQVDEKVWHYSVLWDLRRMVGVPANNADELADQVVLALEHLGPRGPVAIVAWARDVIEGARLYGKTTAESGLRLKLFSTVADAEKWLDAQSAG